MTKHVVECDYVHLTKSLRLVRTDDHRHGRGSGYYRAVVGWNAQDWGRARHLHLMSAGDMMVAGLMPLPAADVLAGDGRPGWIGYVGVEDVDAATEGVRLAGGPITARPPTSPTSAASPSSPIRRVRYSCCSRPGR